MVTADTKLKDMRFLGRKTMTNLDSTLKSRNKKKKKKSRDITFLIKVHLVKAIFFPVTMYVRVILMYLNCGVGEDS